MRPRSLPLLVAALAGLLGAACGVLDCLDSTIPRAPRPINTPFTMTLRVNGQTAEKTVFCEAYYDAICAERGNYWDYRERGFDREGDTHPFLLNDPVLGPVQVRGPTCAELVKGKPYPRAYSVVNLNGEFYWLRSSNGTTRTYATSTAKRNSVARLATLQLEMTVNGQPL